MDAPSPAHTYAPLLAALLVLTGLAPDSVAAQPVQSDSARADSVVVRTAPLDSLPPMRVRLPPVTVEASSLPVSSPPTAVTRIDPASATAMRGRTAADLLAARTNLFVKQRGPGGLATASARGLGGAQTLILVDGHRVADPQTGQTDLSLLPSLLIESARVLRGSHAGRYGSGTLGGVVQLRTLQPTTPLRIEATSGRGALGWHTMGGVVASTGSRWSGVAAAEGTWSDGDFPYENTSLVPTQTRRRQNAHRRHATVFGKMTRRGRQSTSSARLWGNDTERGLPGTANASPSDASQHDRQWRVSIQHRHALPDGHLRLTVRGQNSFLRYRNPDPDPRFAQDDTSRTQRVALKSSVNLAITPQLFASTGTTIGYDRAALRDGVHRWRVGTYVDATWSLGRLTLHPAVRLDIDRPSGACPRLPSGPGRATTALSPQLGAVWQPGPSWLHLKGQIGRAFRAPTFNERFFVPGGDPSLRAESGWSAEAGARVQVGSEDRLLRTEVTAFTTRLRHQIVWQPSYVGPGLQVWRPSNVGRVHTQGIEWTATGRRRLGPQSMIDGQMAFTHVAATDRSNPHARAFDRQLPYRPRQRLKARADVAWHGVRAGLSSRLIGPRYVTADETQSLDPFQVTDARVQIQQSFGPATVTVALRLKNLFDTQYSVVRLHPMPPRHVRARLTIAFDP